MEKVSKSSGSILAGTIFMVSFIYGTEDGMVVL